MRFYKFFILVFLVVATSCGQQRKYISYTVKEGETIKTIAKRLDMKTKDLLRLNPDVGRKPAPNTVIIIPNKGNTSTDTTVKNDTLNTTDVLIVTDSTLVENDSIVDIEDLRKRFLLHQVKKGDTFYRITRLYNISENELTELNPEIDVNALEIDSYLKIRYLDEVDDDFAIYQDTITNTRDLRLAMLLPFRAKQYDTIDGQDIFKSNTLANITTDLYLGADIAIDSLKKQGVNISLSLFDTGKKNRKIDSITRNADLNSYDAIIGPLYSDEVPIVANRTRTPVVFPVYSKSQTKFNSARIVKTYPDKNEHQKVLMDHVLENYRNENVLIIGDSSNVSIARSEQIKMSLSQLDSIQEVKIIHPNLGYIRKDIVINLLKADVGNWVVFATDNNVIASDVINSLISLPTEEPEEEEEEDKKKKSDEPEMQILPEDTVIKIFAFDKNRTYDKIDNLKLAKLGFTFTSDVFVDESSPLVNQFYNQYEAKNNAYPSYYAIKGFDIVYDLGMRLASGDDLKDTFKKGTSFRLESKFEYSKQLFNTTSNKGIFLLQYESDMTIKRLK